MNHPPPSWNDGTGAPEGVGAPGQQGWSAGQEGASAPPPYRGPDFSAKASAPPPYRPPEGNGQEAARFRGERYVLATWGQRAVARIIDEIAVAIPASVAGVAVGFMLAGGQFLFGDHTGDAISRNFAIIFYVCLFLGYTAYDAVCVKKWRRTFGKRLMRLQVAPSDGAGRQGPIPVASITARAALFHVPALTYWSTGWMVIAFLLFLVFCVFWPLWDKPNRQGMHDKLARTVVVRTG